MVLENSELEIRQNELADVVITFVQKSNKYGLGRFFPDELPLLNEMARLAKIEKGCSNGWGPGGCSYTGGCYCDRPYGHTGRCRCVCGRTTTKRPNDG
jgi:hypothetical protein